MQRLSNLISSFAVLVLMAALASCAPGQPGEGGLAVGTEENPDPDPLCAGPGESYGIQDFPCPEATVEGWVAGREGPRTRQHAWYLFAGLNRLQPDGRALWRTWPTSSQAFPDQFATGSYLAAARGLIGARLERPAPDTPRFAGAEALRETPPGVQDATLALPGAPDYALPESVAIMFPACVRTTSAGRHLIDGPSIQSNGDIMPAGVVYSPDAANWIETRGLSDAAYLDSLLTLNPKAPPVQLEMSPNAVALKPMLWPVRYDGWTALPLWDSPEPDADEIDGCEVYSGFERTSLWSRAVALTADPTLEASTSQATASFLVSDDVSRAAGPYDPANQCAPEQMVSGAVEYTNAPVVPLGRFYQVRYTPAELEGMDPCDRALLDQSAMWSYGRRFDARDALVLVAMHMMTREQTGWTFQSAWWFDGAIDGPSGATCGPTGPRSVTQCGRYAGNRPSNVDGPDTWKNYLITTTYGIPQSTQGTHANWWPDSRPTTDVWPVAYNPYIELSATHPIETNCRNCHLRAAWPGPIHAIHASERRFPDRKGAYLVDAPGAPSLLDSLGYGDAIFEGLVTVDALWSIADRASYTGD